MQVYISTVLIKTFSISVILLKIINKLIWIEIALQCKAIFWLYTANVTKCITLYIIYIHTLWIKICFSMVVCNCHRKQFYLLLVVQTLYHALFLPIFRRVHSSTAPSFFYKFSSNFLTWILESFLLYKVHIM